MQGSVARARSCGRGAARTSGASAPRASGPGWTPFVSLRVSPTPTVGGRVAGAPEVGAMERV